MWNIETISSNSNIKTILTCFRLLSAYKSAKNCKHKTDIRRMAPIATSLSRNLSLSWQRKLFILRHLLSTHCQSYPPINELSFYWKFQKARTKQGEGREVVKHIEIWRYTQYYCLYLYKDVEESSERFQKICNITKGLFNPMMFF